MRPLEGANKSVKDLQCVPLHCVRIMEMNISGRRVTSLKHKFPSELPALFNCPMEMGLACSPVIHQVWWLCLITRYVEGIMNRQVMTSLTIWLPTSESVQLSLLELGLTPFCIDITQRWNVSSYHELMWAERCLFFHHTADDPLCCPGRAM